MRAEVAEFERGWRAHPGKSHRHASSKEYFPLSERTLRRKSEVQPVRPPGSGVPAPAGRGNQLQHLPGFALRLRAFAKRRYCRPNEKILEGVVDLQINEDGNE